MINNIGLGVETTGLQSSMALFITNKFFIMEMSGNPKHLTIPLKVAIPTTRVYYMIPGPKFPLNFPMAHIKN